VTQIKVGQTHFQISKSGPKIKAFVGSYFSFEDNHNTVANSIPNAAAQINETVPKVIIIITLLIIALVNYASSSKFSLSYGKTLPLSSIII
jgi:hypothetical protein